MLASIFAALAAATFRFVAASTLADGLGTTAGCARFVIRIIHTYIILWLKLEPLKNRGHIWGDASGEKAELLNRKTNSYRGGNTNHISNCEDVLKGFSVSPNIPPIEGYIDAPKFTK
jgi:hypothetical protein